MILCIFDEPVSGHWNSQVSDLMYVRMFRIPWLVRIYTLTPSTDIWYMLFFDIHDVYHWSSLRLKRLSSHCRSIISCVYHRMQKLCTSMAFFSMNVGGIRIFYLLPRRIIFLCIVCCEFRLVSPFRLVIQRASPKPIWTCYNMSVVVLYTLMTFVMYRSLYTSALHVVVTDCFLILAFFVICNFTDITKYCSSCLLHNPSSVFRW